MAPQTLIQDVGSVYLSRRPFGCSRSPDLLLTNTRSSLALRQNLLSPENTNRFPLRHPISSGLTPLASRTAMAWSQWNTLYRMPGLELSLKKPISYNLLCHCGTPNTAVSTLSSVT
ncbi:hypothetical protein TNCV_183571 [Trichonephila clavipes]|nr:hypothetical protein TNCV_183571 [Trichonephila clavipes]